MKLNLFPSFSCSVNSLHYYVYRRLRKLFLLWHTKVRFFLETSYIRRFLLWYVRHILSVHGRNLRNYMSLLNFWNAHWIIKIYITIIPIGNEIYIMILHYRYSFISRILIIVKTIKFVYFSNKLTDVENNFKRYENVKFIIRLI